MSTEHDLYQVVGEMNGKLDFLVESFTSHKEKTETQIEKIQEELNQSKGAKNAIVAGSGLVAAVIAGTVAALERLWK